MISWSHNFSATLRRPPGLRRTVLISAGFLALVAVSSVCAAADVERARTAIEVIQNSLYNPPSITLSGERTMWFTDGEGRKSQSTCRVWKTAEGRSRSEFADSKGSPAKIVLQRDGKTYTWTAAQGFWQCVDAAAEEHGRDNADLLAANYRLTREDSSYLERPAIVVRAKPVTAGRPSLEVVVDAATSLPVVLEITNPLGGEAYGYRLEKLSLEPFDASILDLPAGAEVRSKEGQGQAGRKRFGRLEDAGSAVRFRILQPAALPAGFCFSGCVLEGDRLRCAYKDGLSVISVYLDKDDGSKQPGGGDRTSTEVKRGGQSVNWSQRRRSIVLSTAVAGTRATVIGEIPLEELLDMTFALAPLTSPSQ